MNLSFFFKPKNGLVDDNKFAEREIYLKKLPQNFVGINQNLFWCVFLELRLINSN